MYDVVIVGAGPAGMTAAIYALRNNKRVALVEKNVPGGVIVNTAFVENYPGFTKIEGPSLAYAMFEQTTKLGADYIGATVTGIEIGESFFTVKTDGESLRGKRLFSQAAPLKRNWERPERKNTRVGGYRGARFATDPCIKARTSSLSAAGTARLKKRYICPTWRTRCI